jgi:3'-5' exonuclease
MLEYLDLTTILFLDIETVCEVREYHQLNETFQDLWHLKARSIVKRYDDEYSEEESADLYTNKAAIYAEYGKIVCISVGIFFKNPETQQFSFRLKSFASDDETEILDDFAELLRSKFNNPDRQYLCGHNIKEFDIPYICRRMMKHQMHLPKMLDLTGKKPWETKHLIDTLELWRFGDIKNYTSLKLLAAVFGFPSPKDDIDGSEVGRVYWEERDLKRLSRYCEKDVLAVAQLLLKYKRMPILTEEQVIHVG